MKKIFIISLIVFILSSCASIDSLPEAQQPLHLRLIASDPVIKDASVKEFEALSEDDKKNIMLKIIEAFGKEEDPYRRMRMLAALTERKTGPYALIPLIDAAADNKSIRDFKEVTAFFNAVKPGPLEIEKLQDRLKAGAWERRMLAMASLSMLSKDAGETIPEMMDMLRDFGRDAGKYSEIFDRMAMINPEIAVAGIIKDIKNKEPEIRRNAVEKLVELQVYLGAKLNVKKEIVPALIRALYSGDKIISDIAEEALSKIEDPDARAAAGNYLKMGRTALNMLYKLAGTSAEEVFKKQEEGIDKKINDYYKSVGREDAIK